MIHGGKTGNNYVNWRGIEVKCAQVEFIIEGGTNLSDESIRKF